MLIGCNVSAFILRWKRVGWGWMKEEGRECVGRGTTEECRGRTEHVSVIVGLAADTS